MCKIKSMIITKGPKAWYMDKEESHHKIISHFKLKEQNARCEYCLVPIEVLPPDGDLSAPLSKWRFTIDYNGYQRDLPPWWDAEKAEAAARAALKEWAETSLKGWKVKEVFSPINPLKVKRNKNLDVLPLLRDWASVRASVRAFVRDSVRDSAMDSVWASAMDSVRASVWDSAMASVMDSVWASVRVSVMASVRDSARDSVWDSVMDSVWAYIGSLFHSITKWKFCDTDKRRPWHSLRKLWINGYVPSFDGTTWRLHAGVNAKVVFEISAKDLTMNK